MKVQKAFVGLAIVLTVGMLPGPAAGDGSVPAPLKRVVVKTVVKKDETSGIFTYLHRVSNPTINSSEVWSMRLDITRASDEAELSNQGLVNGPLYGEAVSEGTKKKVPMVPVGIDGPPGWILGLGVRQEVSVRGLASWGATENGSLIGPGQSLGGFRLTSYGLPSIRTTIIQPDIDYQKLPEEFSDPVKARALRESLLFFTKAVGPKAPPRAFVPMEFLNYLISLVHDSRQQGWIRTDGAQQSLLAKLRNAKRRLEAGGSAESKQILTAFLHEVRAASCLEFDCPGNKPLTSEAFALLFFNGQFLLERLR